MNPDFASSGSPAAKARQLIIVLIYQNGLLNIVNFSVVTLKPYISVERKVFYIHIVNFSDWR